MSSVGHSVPRIRLEPVPSLTKDCCAVYSSVGPENYSLVITSHMFLEWSNAFLYGEMSYIMAYLKPLGMRFSPGTRHCGRVGTSFSVMLRYLGEGAVGTMEDLFV